MDTQNIVVFSAGVVVVAVILIAVWIRSRGARRRASVPTSTFLGLDNRAGRPPPDRPAAPQAETQVARPVDPAAAPAARPGIRKPAVRSMPPAKRPADPQAQPQVARPVEPAAAPRADQQAALWPDDDLALIKDCVEENSRRATALQVPAIFHETYRNIRTWTTSLAPGRYRPEIVSETEIISGRPTTYRFTLKNRGYAIVKTDLTDHSQKGEPLVHETVRLSDADGTVLFEMGLVTPDYRSDEQPGEIAAFAEGSWVDDFKELNELVRRDSKRIGDDFRKKFRAKEAERLKRDFGV